MKWLETTLRKGTKTPKICRDMFIADSNGDFTLCTVKNGRMKERKAIVKEEARSLISEHFLMPEKSIFRGCITYRT